MEENVDHFGLQNVKIIDHVDEETMRDCPVPSTVFMVASASMNQELEYFVKKNPNVHVVIYTLDFQVAAGAGEMLSEIGNSGCGDNSDCGFQIVCKSFL